MSMGTVLFSSPCEGVIELCSLVLVLLLNVNLTFLHLSQVRSH